MHSPIGQNMHPETKITDFVKIIQSGIGGRSDAVFLKFCYVDIGADTDPASLFEKYVDPLGGKEAEQELIVLKKTIAVEQRFATGPVMGKFFNNLKKKKIIGNKCGSCGRMQLPPREICAECRQCYVTNFQTW